MPILLEKFKNSLGLRSILRSIGRIGHKTMTEMYRFKSDGHLGLRG